MEIRSLEIGSFEKAFKAIFASQPASLALAGLGADGTLTVPQEFRAAAAALNERLNSRAEAANPRSEEGPWA